MMEVRGEMRCKTFLGRFGIISLLFLLSLLNGVNTLAFDPERETKQQPNIRAVSLRVLQERAKACMAKEMCPENVLKLCGLKKITGFVIDEKNRDLILVGDVDDSSPPLYLEDFVIALRNVLLKYAPLKGNTYFYSAPGCSIDPNPQILQKLQQLGQRAASDSRQMKSFLQEWKTLCNEPQTVRILGIPFHTRFARVTVEADYYMKRIVNGSVFLGIEGFESLTDITLKEVKEAVVQNRPVSIPISCIDRFWFCPGDSRYLEDKGVVIIKMCQVKLLTEEEFITKTGEVTGAGSANPLAQKFSENFTAKYEQISQKKSIYIELESLFRFVALARIIKYKELASKAKICLDYLINRWPVKETSVDRTLPGLSHAKGFDHRRDFAGGYQIVQLRLPSCGGVSMDIGVGKINFSTDKTEKLPKLRKAVLETRPSQNAVYWDCPVVLADLIL